MSLEDKIDALTKAVTENTAAIKAGGGKPAAAGAAAKAPAKAKPKHTADEVKAVIVELRKKKGADAAKAILAEHGGGNLASMEADNSTWDAVFDAATAAAADEEDGTDGL